MKIFFRDNERGYRDDVMDAVRLVQNSYSSLEPPGKQAAIPRQLEIKWPEPVS
jgi:hypothetical protein